MDYDRNHRNGIISSPMSYDLGAGHMEMKNDTIEGGNIDWQLRSNECVQKILNLCQQLSNCLTHIRREDKITKLHLDTIQSFCTFIKILSNKSDSEMEHQSFMSKTKEATSDFKEELINKALLSSLYQEIVLERSENIKIRTIIRNWIPEEIFTESTNDIEDKKSKKKKENDTIVELNDLIEEDFENIKDTARSFEQFLTEENQQSLYENLQALNNQIDLIIRRDRQRFELMRKKLSQYLTLNEAMKANLLKMSADKTALLVQQKVLIKQLNTMDNRLLEMASENSKCKHYRDFLQHRTASQRTISTEDIKMGRKAQISPIGKVHKLEQVRARSVEPMLRQKTVGE